MANSYKWVISGLHTKLKNEELGLEKVIESIHWRYQATSDQVQVDSTGNESVITADVYGSVGLEAPDAESFKPYEEVTEADVIAWLESKLDVEAMQSGLDAQLDAIANPTHVSLNLVS